MYERDIFYDTSEMSFLTKKEIIMEAKKLCYEWWVDYLPGFQRQRIEMSWGEIIQKFNNAAHFVVIHRRGYPDNGSGVWKWRLEIGFRTFVGTPDYFLYINVEESHIPHFIEKFGLKPLEH